MTPAWPRAAIANCTSRTVAWPDDFNICSGTPFCRLNCACLKQDGDFSSAYENSDVGGTVSDKPKSREAVKPAVDKRPRRTAPRRNRRSYIDGKFYSGSGSQGFGVSITVCFTATEFLRAFVFTMAAFSGWKNISIGFGIRRVRFVWKFRCRSAR